MTNLLLPHPPAPWRPREDTHILAVGIDREETGLCEAQEGAFVVRYCEAVSIELARQALRDDPYYRARGIYLWDPTTGTYSLLEQVGC
jgi:hypothetical protein